MRGSPTTVRVQGLKREELHKQLHLVLARNVTEEQVQVARETIAGRRFEQHGVPYRVLNIYQDDLKRLIAVGVVEVAES